MCFAMTLSLFPFDHGTNWTTNLVMFDIELYAQNRGALDVLAVN